MEQFRQKMSSLLPDLAARVMGSPISSYQGFFAILAGPPVLYLTWILVFGIWKTLKPFIASMWPFRRQILTNLRFDEPLRPVTDEKELDSVFKQDFDESKIPKDLDAIIIGSGISSLTTALMLARDGKKVLVLEQHSSAGGCLGTVKLHDHEFNLGLHLVFNPGFTKLMNAREIINELTAGAVGWTNLPDDLTCVERQSLGEVKEGSAAPPSPICKLGGRSVKDWKERLLKQFPDEKPAIDHFANTFERVWNDFVKVVFLTKFLPLWMVRGMAKLGIIDLFTDWSRWCEEHFEDHLKHVTDNVEMQRALCGVFAYILPPTRATPMAISGTMHHLFTEGFYYPVGGPKQIVFHVIKQIQNLGGQVMVNSNVQSILVDKRGKKVIGVSVQKKTKTPTDQTGPQVNIHAPVVVSGTGVWNTYTKLMPSHIVRNYPVMRAALKENTVPAFSTWLAAYMTFKGTSEELNLDNHDHVITPADLDMHKPWFYEVEEFLSPEVSSDEKCRFSKDEPLQGFPQACFYFTSSRDPLYSSKYPGKSCCVSFIGVPWDWFSKWHDMDQEELDKEEEHTKLEKKVGERLLAYLERRYPQLKDKVDTVDYCSPVRMGSVLGSFHGKMMGLDLNSERFSLGSQAALRSRTGLKGFYMAGQDVFCPGVQFAALSGFSTASEILDRSLILEMEIRARSSGWRQKPSKESELYRC